VAARVASVSGVGVIRPAESVARDALRYQKAHERIQESSLKEKLQDKSAKRLQGVGVVNPGVTEFVDSRSFLFLMFLFQATSR